MNCIAQGTSQDFMELAKEKEFIDQLVVFMPLASRI